MAGSCPSIRADAPAACAMRLTRRSCCMFASVVAESASPSSRHVQPLRYAVGVGADAPLHVGAAGKVLLAWLTKAELEQVPSRQPRRTHRLHDHQLGSSARRAGRCAIPRLGRKPRRAHRRRFRHLGPPVFCAEGEALGAVASVLGPDARLNHTRSVELRLALLRATPRQQVPPWAVRSRRLRRGRDAFWSHLHQGRGRLRNAAAASQRASARPRNDF